MTKLTQAESFVVTELLNHGVFTGTKTDGMSALALAARDAYQRPDGQRRINGWFNQVFGRAPQSFQDNWVWLAGSQYLTPQAVAVLLATLKAVINTPATQGVESDRVIESRPVITSVQTAVPALSDKQIGKIITDLFVDRFRLLTPDNPVNENTPAVSQLVTEYWDVAVDFVPVAQLLVQFLRASLAGKPTQATPQQRVNTYLLTHHFMDRRAGDLWKILQEQKEQIAASWQPLQRFYLEVGDNYAVLLDANRRQQTSRQYFLALATARSLGVGLPKAALNKRIKQLARQLYPKATINSTLVKDAMVANGLAYLYNESWIATPLTKRFAITVEDKNNDNY